MLRRRGLPLFQLCPHNATLVLFLHVRQGGRLFLFAQQVTQHLALDAFPALVQNHLAFCRKFFPGADGGHRGFGVPMGFTHGAEQPRHNQPQDALLPGGQS